LQRPSSGGADDELQFEIDGLMAGAPTDAE
jgi:hypothetical protein